MLSKNSPYTKEYTFIDADERYEKIVELYNNNIDYRYGDRENDGLYHIYTMEKD